MTGREQANTGAVTLVDYGREVEDAIVHVQEVIEQEPALTATYPARWLAMRMLESDTAILSKVEAVATAEAILARARESVDRLRNLYGDEGDTVIADRRYRFIGGLIKRAVQRPAEERITLSDRVDKVILNRVLGIPIFLLAMWVVFQMTATVSGAYLDWVDSVIGGPFTRWVTALFTLGYLGGTWIESLAVEGIIAGVGGVLVFVPVLLFLYFFLGLLEDSGYMARAAFVMDRLMHTLGLHGKSFLPMLLGFGCNVPGIFATRTLEHEDDRVLTGLLVPLMSCGARLPVYMLFATAFFPDHSGEFVFAMYLTGIIFAVLAGMVFKRTLFRGTPPAPFLMELPPYRIPTLKGFGIRMWEQTAAFVRRATTVVLTCSVILWFLMHIPWGVGHPRESLYGQGSAAVAPLFAPAGFGRWEAAGSLATGFVAKELVVATMSQIYVGGSDSAVDQEATPLGQDLREIVASFGEATIDTAKLAVSIIPGVDLIGAEVEVADTALMRALRARFTPLQAVAFNVFVLLYVPCMVVVATLRQEYGTKWMLFSASYLMVLGWTVATLTYQGGRLLGLG
ncbi:MAG: ferrous iron transport protein B [Dehalococcoidia bacterium]|nr:ferrous iron transport protein B [Dehalococcoidia bacterium]